MCQMLMFQVAKKKQLLCLHLFFPGKNMSLVRILIVLVVLRTKHVFGTTFVNDGVEVLAFANVKNIRKNTRV